MRTQKVNPDLDSELAWGTVGWSNGSGVPSGYDLADDSGSGENSLTLVQVTLFRGRDLSQPLDETQAQGSPILCQLSSNFFCIPPLKTRVLVAMPQQRGNVPGAAVILMAVDPRGTQVYSGAQPGDVSLVALLGFAQLLLQANGSASIGARGGNQSGGAAIKLQVNPDGTATLAGADAAIAMCTAIDGFINMFLDAPFAPSPQETAFATLVTALQQFKLTYWTAQTTTGSSKVKAAQ